MNTIPLTQGFSALVDDDDFKRFSGLKWCASVIRGRAYAARGVTAGGKRTFLLHREIMGVTDSKVKVDHENHDTLDCRRDNLRVCTNAQNLANRRGAPSNSTSGIRGLHWDKRDRVWIARVRVNYKRIVVGYFKRKADAIEPLRAAALEHFGEFAGAGHSQETPP